MNIGGEIRPILRFLWIVVFVVRIELKEVM